MPELPEIAHLRRSLEPLLRGAVVRRVVLARPDIVRRTEGSNGLRRRVRGRDLLAGETVRALARHGKELALVSAGGGVLCVHLGMSGQLCYCPARRRLERPDHVHCTWQIQSGAVRGRLVFRDPRRFGGLRSYPSLAALGAERWSRLGPDALLIGAPRLRERLAQTRRVIKAVLLDQQVLAGIGNIYADEILFAARIHPLSPASAITPAACGALANAIRRVLSQAIGSGGSTIRDYLDGSGHPGGFAPYHRVYGRQSEPCVRCGTDLRLVRILQRTTVFCAACQRLYRFGRRKPR